MTLIRGKRGSRENCIANAHRPGSEKKWYGTHLNKLDGEWDNTAEDMMLNFAESGHPTFRATSASERGELKSKGK